LEPLQFALVPQQFALVLMLAHRTLLALHTWVVLQRFALGLHKWLAPHTPLGLHT